MWKSVFVAGMLSASSLAVQPASAQHGHGGHGGGHGHGHGGFSHGHGGHGHGGLGIFLGHSHYAQPYYGSGYYYSPGYAYQPSYSYAYPSPSANYSLAPTTVYRDPMPANQPPPLAANEAVIQVIMPDPEAVLTIDGTKTTSVGRVRVLTPPPLEPGYNYSYKLQAMWTQNSETIADVRTVQVVPGRAVVVDFSRPVNEQIPIPANKQKSSP